METESTGIGAKLPFLQCLMKPRQVDIQKFPGDRMQKEGQMLFRHLLQEGPQYEVPDTHTVGNEQKAIHDLTVVVSILA